MAGFLQRYAVTVSNGFRWRPQQVGYVLGPAPGEATRGAALRARQRAMCLGAHTAHPVIFTCRAI